MEQGDPELGSAPFHTEEAGEMNLDAAEQPERTSVSDDEFIAQAAAGLPGVLPLDVAVAATAAVAAVAAATDGDHSGNPNNQRRGEGPPPARRARTDGGGMCAVSQGIF